MITAEEFLKSKESSTFIIPEEWLIEFAKLHVEAALNSASETVEIKTVETYAGSMGNEFGQLYNRHLEVDRESIINAYPLENIK